MTIELSFFLQYIFTDILHNYIFVTTHAAGSYYRHYLPFTPRQIALHPTNEDIVLAYDEEDSQKRVSICCFLLNHGKYLITKHFPRCCS